MELTCRATRPQPSIAPMQPYGVAGRRSEQVAGKQSEWVAGMELEWVAGSNRNPQIWPASGPQA